MVLEWGRAIRGDGDDLRVYFYRRDHAEELICQNVIGPPQAGEWFKVVGVEDPPEPHFLCLTVWGMGDLNAADVAQRWRGEGGRHRVRVLKRGTWRWKRPQRIRR